MSNLENMVQTVGGKLYEGTDKFKYQVEKQLALTIDEAQTAHRAIVTSNKIIEYIHLFPIENENKSENIDKFLSSIIKAFDILKPIKDSQESIDSTYLSNVLNDCLRLNKIQYSCMTVSGFKKDFDILYNNLHISEVLDEIKKILMSNYSSLVQSKNNSEKT